MDALCILTADFILEYLFIDFISVKSICQAVMLKAIFILTRKSSKTGACARLAAFSCQNKGFSGARKKRSYVTSTSRNERSGTSCGHPVPRTGIQV